MSAGWSDTGWRRLTRDPRRWERAWITAQLDEYHAIVARLSDGSYSVRVGRTVPGVGLLDLAGEGDAGSLDDALALADQLVAYHLEGQP